MSKRPIITICGNLGSGKSTTAREVARILGYPRYSGGDFMRSMADERGVTLMELVKEAKMDPSIDKEIDRRQKEFMETHENFVIDSRLGWYWAPDSFKVFLKLDPRVAAERVSKDSREGEFDGTPTDIDTIAASFHERFAIESRRYQEYYGISDYTNESHFDLVIDTGTHGVAEVVTLVVSEYKKWLTTT